MKKRSILLVMSLVAATGLVFAAGGQEESVAPQESAAENVGEVKVALDAPPDPDTSGTYVWATAFVDYLEGNGASTNVYQRDALGGEEEKLDQVSQGLLEVSLSDVAAVGGLEAMIFGFAQPYMFQSLDHLDRTLANTDLLEQVNASTGPKGVRVLALVCSGTPSGLANTVAPIRTPSDLDGIRLRAKDGMQAEFIQAWGANTVVVPWGEIYNALQTGVADGYLNSPIVPLMFKHEEILTYFSDIRFTIPLRAAICSEQWYQGLSDAGRELIDQAVESATTANREWTEEISAKALDDLRAAGLEVYENTAEEIAQFSELVRPIYARTLGEETARVFLEAAQANR